MIKVFFAFIALLFCFQIIYQQGYKKLVWFVIGILFFPISIVLIDAPVFISFPRLLIYTIVIYTLSAQPGWWQSFKNFPIKYSLIVLLAMLMLIGLFDERLSLFLRIYRPFTVFCENFSLLFISYHYINKPEEALRIYKIVLYALIVFGLFGLVNYYQHQNVYYLLLSETYGSYDFSNVNMLGAIERPRISSFAWHAIYYGFLLNTGILLCAFFINVYSGEYGQKAKYVYLLILLLVNLVLVNSRTPLLALAFGFLVLFLWEFNLVNKLRVGVLVIVLFSSLVFIPKGRQIVSAAFSALSSNEQSYEEGSSLDMRIGQLQASYDLFKKKPVTGNGLYYIKETLGFSRDWSQSKSDKYLYGFESYIYELLIEQGVLGIIGNIFLFASLFIFFIKNNISKNRGTKKLSLLGIALLVAYLSFIIGTGDMGSFPVFMIVMGITIKGIVLLNPFETILSRLNYSADLLIEV